MYCKTLGTSKGFAIHRFLHSKHNKKLLLRKIGAKNLGFFVIVKKLPLEKNRPIGKK
jgi:hypothetical protein